MTNKAWLNSYPAGLPAEIDPDSFSSIPDLLERSAGKFADKPAFHNLGRSMTYAELERQSRAFAAFLQGLPGMAKGERVAVMMPNLLQYPVALFGILRAGMVVVNVNPLYTPRELEHQLKDSGAEAIVINSAQIDLVAHATLWADPRRGTITTLLNGVISELICTGGIDADYVKNRTTRSEQVIESLKKCNAKEISSVTGVSLNLLMLRRRAGQGPANS